MTSLETIRTAIDTATEPEAPALERARMIIVDRALRICPSECRPEVSTTSSHSRP